MVRIISKQVLAKDIYEMDIEAPRVAQSALPGQFVIVIPDEKGERIPLTICDYDSAKGTVNIIFQVVGASSLEMSRYEKGDAFANFVGPLGRPSEWLSEPLDELKKKRILFVGGGVGAAPVYPQVKWLHEHGIAADVIIGARNKDLIILEQKMKAVAGELFVSTDDGSYGFHGLVTDLIRELVEKKGKHYDLAVIIGPMIMMKFTAKLTKELNIPTIVSLNPVMVDGTGMCGACRVSVGGETRFACVDGPEFDGHQVDFDEAMRRLSIYKTEEGRAMLRAQEGDSHKPHGGCQTLGVDHA